jgi:hypothetical protein
LSSCEANATFWSFLKASTFIYSIFTKKILKKTKCFFKDFLSFDEINIECNQVDYKQICLLVLCCYANWLEFRLALLGSSFKHNVYWKSFETRKFKVCWSVSVDLTG